MKKIILAALIMSMTSIASAQVALSGKVSLFGDNTEVGGAKSTQLVTDPTSNVAVSVSEKLGMGLTAKAVVETSLRGNTIDGVGTKLGDRQGTVGLSHALGSVELGRNVHSHFLAITTNDVFGTLYGSVAGDVHNLRSLRLGDAVFVSASPLKGVSLVYERSLGAVGPDATVIGASGALFGVKGVATRFEQGAETSTVLGLSTKALGFNVAYTFSDNKGVAKSQGNLIGVSRAFGPVTAKASYGQNNADVKAYAIGADYALSKRTELSVAYRNVDRLGSAQDVQQLGVGVTHRF